MKKVKKLEVTEFDVTVTFQVGFGNINMPEKVYQQLKEHCKDGREIDGMAHDKFNEARFWLNDNIELRDLHDIKYLIDECHIDESE